MTAQPVDVTDDPESWSDFWAVEDLRPLRHHRSVCTCPDPAFLLDAIHDAVLDEDGDE